jgi:hypothetical protein
MAGNYAAFYKLSPGREMVVTEKSEVETAPAVKTIVSILDK